MKKPVVYRLCASDGSFYVGSSGKIEHRLSVHKYQLKSGTHHNSQLQEAYDNGEVITVGIDVCETRSEAYALEQTYINTTPPEVLLNIGVGVVGGDNLSRNPNKAEIVSRISETLRTLNGNMTPEERVDKFGKSGELNGMFGRTHTEESRELIRQKVTTSENIAAAQARRLGVKATDETRKKISEYAKTRTGEKNSFFGKQHSDEFKQRMSESKKGTLPPNTRSIEIDGQIYPSMTEASRQLGVVPATILHRMKSKNPKYETYRFVVEGPTTTESDERNKTIDE